MGIARQKKGRANIWFNRGKDVSIDVVKEIDPEQQRERCSGARLRPCFD